MLKCCSSFVFILLIFVQLSVGHLGHDHHEDHGSHNEQSEDKDSVWQNSRNISLTRLTGVDLKWVDSDAEWISMKMSSRTSGYVSVGFCAQWVGTMANCDIVIGWVDDTNSSVHLHDYHATANAAPILDDQQDYELIRGAQKDGVTTIEFRRKWDTSDEVYDADLGRNSVHIIYSWHPSDPSSSDEIPPHDRNSRGHTLTAVNLRNPSLHYNDHHQHHAEHNHNTSAANSIQKAGFLWFIHLVAIKLIF